MTPPTWITNPLMRFRTLLTGHPLHPIMLFWWVLLLAPFAAVRFSGSPLLWTMWFFLSCGIAFFISMLVLLGVESWLFSRPKLLPALARTNRYEFRLDARQLADSGVLRVALSWMLAAGIVALTVAGMMVCLLVEDGLTRVLR